MYPPEPTDAGRVVAPGAAFSVTPGEGEVRLDRWWRSFGDEQLDRLVVCALTNNLSLAQAEARLRQARELAVQAGASLRPDVSASASASETARRADAAGGGHETTTRESFGLGLSGSYEADVWGRLRAVRNAAEMEARATQSDREAVAMTITGEVTARYLEWLAQVQTVALLEEQAATNRKVLELLKERYARARASALDVFQQQSVVAQTEALLPGARATEELLRRELAVLIGLPPQADLGLEPRPLPPARPPPEPGLPVELLVRRPDVRAAAERLEKAGWQVSAARADRLPALRLTASATASGEQLAQILDHWAASLAANLVAPLADGGRRVSEVARARAVADERLAAYRAAVLAAVLDVESALVRERRQRETVEALERQVEAVRQTETESMRRYSRGLESYLSVLTAKLSLQGQQRALIQARYTMLAYRVQVCRALGGDWEAVLAAPAGEAGGEERKADVTN